LSSDDIEREEKRERERKREKERERGERKVERYNGKERGGRRRRESGTLLVYYLASAWRSCKENGTAGHLLALDHVHNNASGLRQRQEREERECVCKRAVGCYPSFPSSTSLSLLPSLLLTSRACPCPTRPPPTGST
jgi:hypothetical protein